MIHSEKWQRRFLSLAKEVSTWSHDPSTKVGAVIADENKIVRGLGYNSFPRGVRDLEERYLDRETKLSLIVHAEVNAILNSNGDLENCSLYVYPTIMFPVCCKDCAKFITQTKIKEVIGCKKEDLPERWKEQSIISKLILDETKIEYFLI